MSIRIGILGYGNLGRGVECAIKQNADMELAAVFTRRDPATVQILTDDVPVCRIADVQDWKDKIDVMILCGGRKQIFQSRHQCMQRCSMSLTALIHMQEFRNILRMLMRQLKKVVISALFL